MDDKINGNRRELSLDEIQKVSSSIGNFDKLLISGGEPFLRDDLVEICKIFYNNNGIRYLHLPTNGFYSEKIYDYIKQILSSCPNIRLEAGLPLDGLRETHDTIKGVAGSFDRVVDAIKRISELKRKFKNFEIYVITVVNNKNIDEIIPLCDYIKGNLPVDGYGPSPMRGSPYDKELSAPSYKEWDKLAKRLIGYQRYWNGKKTGNIIRSLVSINRTRYMYRLYTHILKNGRLPFTCQAGRTISVLEPNGDVRICELTKAVGNIRDADYNLKTVLSSDTAKEMMRKAKDCACTHACFLTSSMASSPHLVLRSYFG